MPTEVIDNEETSEEESLDNETEEFISDKDDEMLVAAYEEVEQGKLIPQITGKKKSSKGNRNVEKQSSLENKKTQELH